jgi:hypothetical protein
MLDAKVKDAETVDKSQLQKKFRSEDSNWIASTLNVIGWIGIVVTIIVASRVVDDFQGFAVIYTIAGIVSSLFIIGFSEVIRLLHKIYLNTKKSPPSQ